MSRAKILVFNQKIRLIFQMRPSRSVSGVKMDLEGLGALELEREYPSKGFKPLRSTSIEYQNLNRTPEYNPK